MSHGHRSGAALGPQPRILHRLERGEDITLSSLFDILRACGLSLQLVSAGLPTLAEMRQRFSQDDDESPT